jgi:hypothetical protein
MKSKRSCIEAVAGNQIGLTATQEGFIEVLLEVFSSIKGCGSRKNLSNGEKALKREIIRFNPSVTSSSVTLTLNF